VQLRRCERRDVCTEFWWEYFRERDHLEELSIDERIILKWILKLQDGRVEWMDLAQDRNRWRALVNTMTSFGSHKMRGIS